MANPTLGLPLFLFPYGFQIRACLVMLRAGFLRVWPIQPHFLLRICVATGSWSAASPPPPPPPPGPHCLSMLCTHNLHNLHDLYYVSTIYIILQIPKINNWLKVTRIEERWREDHKEKKKKKRRKKPSTKNKTKQQVHEKQTNK